MHVLYMYTYLCNIAYITYTVAIKKFDQKYGLRNTPNKMLPIPGIAKTVLLPVHSNLNIANKFVRPFLFTISNNSLYLM